MRASAGLGVNVRNLLRWLSTTEILVPPYEQIAVVADEGVTHEVSLADALPVVEFESHFEDIVRRVRRDWINLTAGRVEAGTLLLAVECITTSDDDPDGREPEHISVNYSASENLVDDDVTAHRWPRWWFAFADPLVTQLRVDNAFSLVLASGSVIRIDEPFELHRIDGVVAVPASEAVWDVGAALSLYNQRVARVTVDEASVLRIVFEGDVTVVVPSNPAYESWIMTSCRGRRWIGLPGGGVAAQLC